MSDIVTSSSKTIEILPIDFKDRSKIAVYADRAQQDVNQYTDKILSQIKNKDLGDTGDLLTDILSKAKSLDASTINDKGLFSFLSSIESKIKRFTQKFEVVSDQINHVSFELDNRKENLRRDIAMLDTLYANTERSIVELEQYIDFGSKSVEIFKNSELNQMKNDADSENGSTNKLLAAERYQNALQAVDRFEKRLLNLRKVLQVGIQQLSQIRIIQSGDETLIDNLQTILETTLPLWKQKMVLLLGLENQRKGLELQNSVVDATNEMLKQTSSMMKQQSIDIEKASQRGIIDIETLEATNRDLIETISEVLKIQKEGREQRANVETQLDTLNKNLKETLLRSA